MPEWFSTPHWRRSFVALTLCAAAPARAMPPDQAAYEAALTAYRAGRLDDALAALKDAYALSPRAIYLYNTARVLDRAGLIADAYDTFLRAMAQTDADEALRVLCREQLSTLGAVRDRAVVSFASLPQGSAVQVGKEMIADLGADVVLDAGPALICVARPLGQELRCSLRRLSAGRRLTWPPPAEAVALIVLTNDLADSLTSLRVGSIPVQADWRRVTEVLLDGVVSDVSLRLAGGSATPVGFDLVPGSRRTLSSLLPVATAVETAPPAAVEDEVSPAIGPWITVGTGAAAVLGGIGFLVYAHTQATTPLDTPQTDASATWSTALTYETTGWALGGAGLAAVAAGLGWYFASSPDEAPVTFGVDARPGGGAVSIRGGF